MSKTRQLAAIMFTDIVGFTSLMGNDEQKAFEILEKNRTIHKPIINEFNGIWIKELGDGVIASFKTVSDAVHAAIKIQETCNSAAHYSLRIGIHQAEVVFEDNDVFGDGVNIASRIQTAAKPGSIFISETVNNNISNKNHIKTHFVKVEELKNVSQPMKLYQVLFEGSEHIVPEKHTIKKTSKKRLVYVVVPSLILVALFTVLKLTNAFSSEKIESNNKIAVLEFENTTENKNLNNVGKITSNWIIHGITENQIGQVISPKLVNDYTSLIKSKSADLNNLLKNYFNPDKVIVGVYYEENGKLLLQCSIKDGLIDETLISFETISCDPNSPLDCAEKLKQEILGYLTTVDKQDNQGYIKDKDNQRLTSYYEETPPNYEAYQFLLNALENQDNDEIYIKLLNKSIETDPSFFEPKIHKIAYYYNKGEFKTVDSLRLLINDKSKLNDRQENIMLFYESIIKGKNVKAYRAHKEEYKKAYKDLSTNMSQMTLALQYVNRPEDIGAIYNEIPMEDLILEDCSTCGFRYYMKSLADVELGNYDEVIKTLLPITNTIEDNYYKRPLISAFVKAGKYEELDKYLSDYALTASTNDINYLYSFTGIQFLNSNQTEEANTYFNKIISRKSPTLNSVDLAHAYYFKTDYIKALEHYKLLYDANQNNIDYIIRLAICNYKITNSEEAKNYIDKLNTLKTDFQFGAIDYGLSQYYATIGDYNKAIQFLEKAVAQGFNFTPSTFQNDPHFRTIKDSPEFINRIMNYWKNKTS
ncbi:adenylate/guanylate cyclase domain-containing protein [Psychroserpens sp.]|uniref:adenylate/guanylate cyclase domain-containing protein n=1 Tax=Psychroserpens sp. TaxID=2020870 RepID=UPI002B2768A3|nr:adenylate/guanylate cyclase domain-containing protein [Psychroserpens sp.]